MNWNKLLLLLLSFVFLGILKGQKQEFVKSNLLRVPKETNFGKVKVGETKRITIKVKNISKQTIALEHFTNNCTCVNVVYLNQKGIKSGEEDSIVIQYKPLRQGYIEENLLLYIKGVDTPLFCKLKGRVVRKKSVK